MGRIAPGNPETCRGHVFTNRYPYVAKLSGGVATDHPRERVRAEGGRRQLIGGPVAKSDRAFSL